MEFRFHVIFTSLEILLLIFVSTILKNVSSFGFKNEFKDSGGKELIERVNNISKKLKARFAKDKCEVITWR